MKTPTPQQIMPQFNAYITTGRVEYRPASNSWVMAGEPVSERQLAKRLAYDLNVAVNKAELVVNIRAAQMQVIKRDALRQWVKGMEHRPADDTVLRQFLTAMQREDTDPEIIEANVWAMKQWMWQVKRNILGLKVTWHVLPIFWTRENGTGKSFNVARLLGPVEDYTRHMNVEELSEKFGKKLLSQTYIAFFDEFAGAQDVDLATFKAMITGRPLEGREMFSEGGFYAENRVSCIATSNLAPPHDFEDNSGARRFWSIHCHSEAKYGNSPRGKALDALDWPAIWSAVSVYEHSIEELIPGPIYERMKREREHKMRAKSSFELFVAECLEPSEPTDRTLIRDVLEAFRVYCRQASLRREKGGQKVTQERLADLGFTCVNSSTVRYVCGQRLKTDQ